MTLQPLDIDLSNLNYSKSIDPSGGTCLTKTSGLGDQREVMEQNSKTKAMYTTNAADTAFRFQIAQQTEL